MPTSIQEINQMKYPAFMQLLGNIVEKAPWITSAIWSCKPFSNGYELSQTVRSLLDDIPLTVQEAVLRGFADIVGQENRLTAESIREQAAAGLPQITQEQRQTIYSLNEKYKHTFGFPFIICARDNKIDSILNGLHTRLPHSREQEVLVGINEVKKILWYRIAELVTSSRVVVVSKL